MKRSSSFLVVALLAAAAAMAPTPAPAQASPPNLDRSSGAGAM
jgi:hypothetical protein